MNEEILVIHFKAEFNWPTYDYLFRIRTGNLFPLPTQLHLLLTGCLC